MSIKNELGVSENPRKWRFSWESQSQLPILKLNLFNPNIKPSTQCIDLKVSLFLEKCVVKVSWFEAEVEVSLRVPMPKVLVDFESPVHFKALDDHIEVKVSLLFSIDNPLVSTLDSVINLSLEENKSSSPNLASSDETKPLSMDYDIECLSSTRGVYFYCRNCSTKLTTFLRFFEEMPSVNWREVADNWFGNCCCSFGGVSEKMVTSYAKSYTSTAGVCLLNTTSVILSKDDLVGFHISDRSHKQDNELDCTVDNCVNNSNGSKDERIVSSHGQKKRMHDIDGQLHKNCSLEDNITAEVEHKTINSDTLSLVSLSLEDEKNVESPPRSCIQDHDIKCCGLGVSEPSAKEQESNVYGLLENQKSFLNGFLGNIFMTQYISKDVKWAELSCPCCSCLLGAYPSGSGDAPLDSGVHFFKCYISTCSGVGPLSNIFRRYTLEKMFTNQLLESAKDELSFRTLIRDLQTKHPMLQIVLLNPNSWFCFGYFSSIVEQVPRINMYPSMKLLFSDCRKSDECQLRTIEEWVTKNQADEVYMLASQIKELTGSLESVKDILPPSHTLLQGFSLSSLRM